MDAVVCHHAHVAGAYEVYRDKPIFYCLGNFIFETANPPSGWDQGYMVELKFDASTKTLLDRNLVPYQQSVAVGGIKLLENAERDKFLAGIQLMNATLEDNAQWMSQWQSWVKVRGNSYLRNQYSPVNFKGLGVLWRRPIVEKLFFNKKNTLKKLNLIRCESHRELLQAALEFKIQNAQD